MYHYLPLVLFVTLGISMPFHSKSQVPGNTMESLAAYYEAQGQYALALAHLHHAETAILQASEERPLRLAAISTATGRVLNQQGRYGEALSWWQKALRQQGIDPEAVCRNDWALRDSVPVVHDAALAARGLAEALHGIWKTNRDDLLLEQALAACLNAIAIDEYFRREFLRNRDENRQWTAQNRTACIQAIEMARLLCEVKSQPSYLETAFRCADRIKSLLLTEGVLGAEAKKFAGVPPELLARESELGQRIAWIEKKVADALAANDTSQLARYNTESLFQQKKQYDLLTSQIERDYPRYFEMKYAGKKNVSAAALSAALDPSDLFIEYVLDEDNRRLYIFTITKNDGLRLIVRALDGKTKQQILDLKALMESVYIGRNDQRLRFIQASYLLYQQFIQPVESSLTGKKNIVIIGEGDICYLPFELLLDNPVNRPYKDLNYLMRRFNISYYYSATLFHRAFKTHANSSNKNTLLAFAPVFNDLASVRSTDKQIQNSGQSSRRHFTPILYSEQETRTIAALFGGDNTKLLLHQDANEAALKWNLRLPYGVVHIASHSFADMEQPKFSGIACTRPSGDNAPEDGILYVSEIYNLTIPANLVVLSSCESGLGPLSSSEGLLGLNRAFAYAGVPNSVFSIWKVYDKAGSELMIPFYKEMLAGKSYSAALRAAKLKMLENPATASPNLWGGFLLMGR